MITSQGGKGTDSGRIHFTSGQGHGRIAVDERHGPAFSTGTSGTVVVAATGAGDPSSPADFSWGWNGHGYPGAGGTATLDGGDCAGGGTVVLLVVVSGMTLMDIFWPCWQGLFVPLLKEK